jgi:tripartite-type tricarboxylate transporter receptor subunit TctC
MRTIMRAHRLRLALLLIVATIGSTGSGHPQEWPQHAVKIIVPYAAGGTSDGVGRILAVRLGALYGQPFIIENRPGASGVIAAEAVARAPADGYTLFLPSVPQIAGMPATMNTSFDPHKDVVPICLLWTTPLALVVHPSLPATSIKDFVAYARRQRGELTYAAVGTGSITHLAMALFLKRAGVEMTAVMYKGGAPAVTDLIAGHVKAHFALSSNVIPYTSEGMLRLLAVSSEKRMPQIPNVPTMIESGYPGFKMLNWTGLMAPAGTPKVIVDRLSRAVSQMLKDPELAQKLIANGVDPQGGSPEEFAETIATDIQVWDEAIKAAGLQKQ